MTYSAEVLADSPLGYWRLGEASGTTMTDSSGNGRNGTYSGTLVKLGRTPLITDSDTSVHFPGAGTHLGSVANGSWMNVSPNMTIEAWVRSTPQAISSIADRDQSGQRVWQFRLEVDGRLSFITTAGTGGVVTSSTPSGVTVKDSYPHHVVATYDGSHIRLYLDGALQTTTARTGTLASTTSPLVVGIGYSGTSTATQAPFPGLIDEVAFYGTALSGARITAHYDAGVAAAPPSGDDIGGVWGWA